MESYFELLLLFSMAFSGLLMITVILLWTEVRKLKWPMANIVTIYNEMDRRIEGLNQLVRGLDRLHHKLLFGGENDESYANPLYNEMRREMSALNDRMVDSESTLYIHMLEEQVEDLKNIIAKNYPAKVENDLEVD